MTEIRMKDHRPLRIGMGFLPKKPLDRHRRAELFSDLAQKAVVEGFSRISFSSGEFPKTGKMDPLFSAGYQDLPVPNDNRNGNFNNRLLHRFPFRQIPNRRTITEADGKV